MSENSNKNRIKFKEKLDKIKFTVDNNGRIGYIKNIIIVIIIKIKRRLSHGEKALYNLSYGVFMLSTRSGEKVNGCITNTCMQVANDPVRIAISVLNSNYTL